MKHLNQCVVFLLAAALAACAPSQGSIPRANAQAQIILVPTSSALPPYATPTLYYSAPVDGGLDTACRITINLFFSYRQGFSLEAYRSLFVPSSQQLAEIKPPLEARILLKLMPASQWWQQNLPGTPIPGTILPQEPNEYFYHAEFTGHYEPDTTPVIVYPDQMTLIMIGEGPESCKIKGYGKG